MGAKHNKKKSRTIVHSMLLFGQHFVGNTALLESYEYMLKNNIEYDEKSNKPLDLDISRNPMHVTNDYRFLDIPIKGEQNKEKIMKVKIWDSPGSERFRDIRPQVKNTQGLLLTYDITRRESFEHLNQLISQIKDVQDISIFPIVIVGCKFDLEDKRKVSTEEGQQLAEKYNLTFFETSALTGKGVKEVFTTLIQKIYDRNKRN